MDVTFRQIRSFLAVARCGSFTQAAQLLHLSQPALTIHIKQLEIALGLKLFDRSTHHVRLTRAGTSFVPVISKIVGEFEHAIASARKLPAKAQETVRFACFPSFAATLIPRAIGEFRETHPHVSFVIRDVAARNVVAMTRSEEVDCGICDYDPSATDLDSAPLLEDEMHVVYPRHHALGKLNRTTLKSVIEYPLVLLNADSNARSLVDAAVSAAGYFVMPAGEAAYMSTALALVEAGLGVTILPQLAINLRAHPDLRSRRIDDTPFIRPISVITKKNYFVPPAARAFTEVLIAVCGRYMAEQAGSGPGGRRRRGAYRGTLSP